MWCSWVLVCLCVVLELGWCVDEELGWCVDDELGWCVDDEAMPVMLEVEM